MEEGRKMKEKKQRKTSFQGTANDRDVSGDTSAEHEKAKREDVPVRKRNSGINGDDDDDDDERRRRRSSARPLSETQPTVGL